MKHIAETGKEISDDPTMEKAKEDQINKDKEDSHRISHSTKAKAKVKTTERANTETKRAEGKVKVAAKVKQLTATEKKTAKRNQR